MMRSAVRAFFATSMDLQIAQSAKAPATTITEKKNLMIREFLGAKDRPRVSVYMYLY
jgi:hypothetical protein